jgi:exodeoxyribonuclease VII large subunit
VLPLINLAAVDVILISRGGGAQDKLAEVFDSYLVAEAICQSRVPVITAIGHTSDKTFADVIADDRMDTPTRAAVELARIKTKRGLFG